MKRTISFLVVLLLSTGFVLQALRWQPNRDETVLIHRGKELHIQYAVKPCLYLGWRHAMGLYIYPGATRLNIKGAKPGEVVINEELSLFAAHSFGNYTYFIFESEYKPERGFLAFKATENYSFERVNISDIPKVIAYPNIGNRFEKFKEIISSNSLLPEDFFHSKTARLWSQIATGRSVEEERMSVEEVEKFWTLWVPEMKKRINAKDNQR